LTLFIARFRSSLPWAVLASLSAVACPFDERILEPQKLDLEGNPGPNPDGAGAGGDQAGAAGAGGTSEGGAAGTAAGSAGESGTSAGGPAGGTGAQGGSSGSGGSSGGGGSSGSGGSSGTNGSGGTGGGIVGPNLLLNGTFSSDTGSWVAAAHSALAWTQTNGSGSGGGSMGVTNNVSDASTSSFQTGGEQCVAVAADSEYLVSVEGYLAAGQPGGVSARLNIWHYTGAGCTGTLTAEGAPPHFTGVGTWFTLTQVVATPADSASMLVRLVVSKRYNDPAVTALFDNAQVIEID
jgi:hypothetical protein